MYPGDVLADRFVIERLAGSGGMGRVYRALDRVTGAPVALKLVTDVARDDERFAQEARVLSELTHPAIVKYVAHGITTQGQPFLAMEWLEGEDLAQRLARTGLGVSESVTVVRRIADGLAGAHARGVVHRDVKPSNVFLVRGDPSRAKLLDFGIVRLQLSRFTPTARPMTHTGTLLGTVGYMSPEQATADRALDGRTDVFALGSVLFECLTGKPAFSGEHVVAVLAKVLREEAPRVRQLRPDLSAELDDLVARMLSKDKTGRPADGGAVLRELEKLGSVVGGVPESAVPPSLGLSVGEQRLVSVILAVVPDEPDRVGEVVRRHGADAARLANGALLVTLGGRGSTSERVVAAAACALELREAFPDARIALATGRAHSTAGGPPGPVIDHAATLLAQSMSAGIRVDEVTAGLLGESFEVQQDGNGQVLLGGRSDVEAPRTLLGKPTPCVGRDKELGLLELTLRECIDETVARVVLVTGPPGQGKSRLRHEFVARARERGGIAVLTARADPVGAGSAFMLARQLVRHAVGLREGDPAAEQHPKLLGYVTDLCKGSDVLRIADFLGELVGAPSSGHPSPQLRVARNDPQIMGEWLRRSFGEWLAAECDARPHLLVLEDLHWGDLPSVTYLGEALRALAAKPLMVLALARPEVHDTFPSLWTAAEVHEVPLGRLTPRAAERLVRAALGEEAAADSVSRIVQRADGNAFYLEELVRRVAERGGDTLPATVLALVQSRLERLEPEARRIVRAASVFGEVFRPGGVAALLGEAADVGDLNVWLKALAEREVFAVGPDIRFPGEREYAFRHDLLREAAYAMLTDTDRETGHRLAGEWLDLAGEKDALSMADHFERGGERKRAVPWLLRAAQAAVDGGNVEAAVALGHRGIACGPEAAERGLLRSVQANALALRGDWRGCAEMAREAMGLLSVGSTPWFLCATIAFLGGMFLGDSSITAPVLQAILDVSIQPEPSGPYGLAVSSASFGLATIGPSDLARTFLGRAEVMKQGASDPDPVFVLWLRDARGYLQLMSGELGSALASLSQARVLADRIPYAFGGALVTCHLALAMVQTGHTHRARTLAQELIAICEPHGLSWLADSGAFYMAQSMLIAHRAPEAIVSLRALVARLEPMTGSGARAYLAHALIATGDLRAATDEATTAMEKGSVFPNALAIALGALARIALYRREPIDALAFADRGLAKPGGWYRDGSILRLARAEALHALGRREEARVAIGKARDRILRTAATLDDPELRESYVTNIDANERTLTLAREWLGEQRAVV
jgi:eukaryotic-like serine/threonine-protein kinase